jgi:hypothetical protein
MGRGPRRAARLEEKAGVVQAIGAEKVRAPGDAIPVPGDADAVVGDREGSSLLGG